MPIDRRRLLTRTITITMSGCYFMVNTLRKHISGNVCCHWGQVSSRFSVHQRHHPQRLWRASCLHWWDVWSRYLLCREFIKEQPVCLRHRRRDWLSDAQRSILLSVPQVTGPVTRLTGFNGSLQLDGRGLTSLLWSLRQMLFCRVTLGKSFLQFSAMKMAHAPPGHHSVIGRPSVNGLAYAEYVIYRGEQVKLPPTPH